LPDNPSSWPAAGVASAYSYLIPVFAAGSAWIVLAEPITMAVVVCGSVIAAGVYLVNRA
jgi:drug/metabolite transporter (DMT)-like permease